VQHSGDGARSPIVKSPIVISNTPFIAAYTINYERIVILAIYHGAQLAGDPLIHRELAGPRGRGPHSTPLRAGPRHTNMPHENLSPKLRRPIPKQLYR
jgi:hypothetical protein